MQYWNNIMSAQSYWRLHAAQHCKHTQDHALYLSVTVLPDSRIHKRAAETHTLPQSLMPIYSTSAARNHLLEIHTPPCIYTTYFYRTPPYIYTYYP